MESAKDVLTRLRARFVLSKGAADGDGECDYEAVSTYASVIETIDQELKKLEA